MNRGAYRAAYVFAWISAAESLLNRLVAMGAGQADIGAFVKKVGVEHEAGYRKDVILLGQATKAGFIDLTEHKVLCFNDVEVALAVQAAIAPPSGETGLALWRTRSSNRPRNASAMAKSALPRSLHLWCGRSSRSSATGTERSKATKGGHEVARAIKHPTAPALQGPPRWPRWRENAHHASIATRPPRCVEGVR